MLIFTNTYHRPNLEVQWHDNVIDSTAYLPFFMSYHENGKILHKYVSEGTDGLSKTWTIIFDSKESYQEYIADVNLKPMWGLKNQYNNENGIVRDEPVLEDIT